MDEMNAFERQLSAQLGEMAGPGRRVDGMAMVRTISTQTPKWRLQPMFSATKFVFAGVIAVLLGALALGGLQSEPEDATVPAMGGSASPMAQTDPAEAMTQEPIGQSLLLGADLDVEQVGRGVYRVVGDGVHDFSAVMSDPDWVSISAGHDGSVWMQSSTWAMPLGQPGILEHPQRAQTLQVAPDGTVWVKSPDLSALDDVSDWPNGLDLEIRFSLPMLLSSFDGEQWTVQPVAKDVNRGDPIDWVFDIASDGSLWYASSASGARVARLGPDGWERLEGRGPGYGLLVTDEGTVWSQDNAVFYDPRGWRPLQGNDEETRVARDGTVWIIWTGEGPMRLSREDDDGRESCAAVGGEQVQFHQPARMSVAPDGSLWGTYREGMEPNRLIRFDCAGWTFPLSNVPMAGPSSIAIAADGSVWVVTEPESYAEAPEPGAPTRQLYVITPEAFSEPE